MAVDLYAEENLLFGHYNWDVFLNKYKIATDQLGYMFPLVGVPSRSRLDITKPQNYSNTSKSLFKAYFPQNYLKSTDGTCL